MGFVALLIIPTKWISYISVCNYVLCYFFLSPIKQKIYRYRHCQFNIMVTQKTFFFGGIKLYNFLNMFLEFID